MARLRKNKTDIMKNMGARIYTQRTALGLTRKQVVVDLGISHQQLQKYETGTDRISCDMIMAIAEVLCVPVMHFFDGVEKKYTPESNYRHRLNINVSRNFSKIENPEYQEAVSILVKTLSGNN